MPILKNSLYEWINAAPIWSAEASMPFRSASIFVSYLEFLNSVEDFTDDEKAVIKKLIPLVEIDFRKIESK